MSSTKYMYACLYMYLQAGTTLTADVLDKTVTTTGSAIRIVVNVPPSTTGTTVK